MSAETDARREVTRIALAGIAEAGFALAGSGAIREHGVIDRPTEDVDGLQLDVDMGVDWRENDPVTLDVGPVLSLGDAVGNKVAAVYSRGEPRDYLDVDAICGSKRFTDEELVTAAAERDAGFDVSMFAQQLEAVRRVTPLDVRRYGVSAEQLEGAKARYMQWAAHLRGQSEAATTQSPRLTGPPRSALSASYPKPGEATRGGAQEPAAASRGRGPYLPGRGYGGAGRGE